MILKWLWLMYINTIFSAHRLLEIFEFAHNGLSYLSFNGKKKVSIWKLSVDSASTVFEIFKLPLWVVFRRMKSGVKMITFEDILPVLMSLKDLCSPGTVIECSEKSPKTPTLVIMLLASPRTKTRLVENSLLYPSFSRRYAVMEPSLQLTALQPSGCHPKRVAESVHSCESRRLFLCKRHINSLYLSRSRKLFFCVFLQSWHESLFVYLS